MGAAIRDRAERTDVSCTGRNAPPELVDLADTGMRKVEHAYGTGVRARRGLDLQRHEGPPPRPRRPAEIPAGSLDAAVNVLGRDRSTAREASLQLPWPRPPWPGVLLRSRRRRGGVTGDVLGASIELALAGYLVRLVLAPAGAWSG